MSSALATTASRAKTRVAACAEGPLSTGSQALPEGAPHYPGKGEGSRAAGPLSVHACVPAGHQRSGRQQCRASSSTCEWG